MAYVCGYHSGDPDSSPGGELKFICSTGCRSKGNLTSGILNIFSFLKSSAKYLLRILKLSVTGDFKSSIFVVRRFCHEPHVTPSQMHRNLPVPSRRFVEP